jgi:hypothetical protein
MDMATGKILPEQADKLFQDYETMRAALSDQLLYGVPESLLPAPKDVMADALGLMQRQALAEGDSLMLDRLRLACIALANFLPLDEAALTSELKEAIDGNNMAYLNTAEAQIAQATIRRMEDGARRYADEFDARCTQQQSDGLLTEIDALLDELSHKYAAPASNG